MVIEDKGEIIAIAPLRQSRYSVLGPFGYEVIEPLAYQAADYTGIMLAEREKECLTLILDHLFQHSDWDFMYLHDFQEKSLIPELLTHISDHLGITYDCGKGKLCPYRILPNSMDILVKELGAKFRHNLRYYRQKMEKNYKKVEFKKYDELGSVEETAKTFIELHQKRWNLKGLPGAINTQITRDFFIDLSRKLANNGWLALYFLTANDEPIAGLYCVEYDHTMYEILSGFDPDFSRYSVGNLLHAKVIEKCIEKKIEEFDFMKGDESYKLKYTKMMRRNWNIRFANKKFTTNLYNWGIKTAKRTKLSKIFETRL